MNTTKSKRITVLCNAAELYKVDCLTLAYFGATRPEILRLGIDALSGAPPPVVLQPQVLPLPMLKFALGNINNLTRSLDAAVRNGWPDHIQGETAERKKMVEEARGEFKSVREELKPLRNDLFMKLAACAALPTSDVPLLRAATECLRLWVEFLDRRIADVAYASMIAENKAYLDCILHLFRFMETLGLVQKPSKGHVALIIFDVATLSKAVVLLHTDLAFRRERIKAGILDPVELAKTNDRVSAFDHLVGFLKSILTIQGTGPSN